MANFITQYPPTKCRYCAKCDTLVEYTEKRTGDAWQGHQEIKQFCTGCGCIVGMRYEIQYPKKGHVDPYQYTDSYIRHHRNGW